MRTAHEYLDVPIPKGKYYSFFFFFFGGVKMLGSLSRISNCLMWAFMELQWGLLLMNPSFKSRTNQDFQIHSLFLRGLIYLLIYFT